MKIMTLSKYISISNLKYKKKNVGGGYDFFFIMALIIEQYWAISIDLVAGHMM